MDIMSSENEEALLVNGQIDIPELRANKFSHYTLHWIGHYLGIGNKISEKDIPGIISKREADTLCEKLNKSWTAELKTDSPSLLRAVWNTEKFEIIKWALLSLFAGMCNFFSMTFIGILIDWFGDNSIIGEDAID